MSLVGELCHSSAPLALESLAPLADHADTLIVDLSRVTFMDTGGVSALLDRWRRTTGRGGGRELRSPSGNVMWMLELVVLDDAMLRSKRRRN